MLEIIIGIISGMITGIGMGGGTVLILLLTMILEYDQKIAQATNLIFFIPTSLSAILVNLKDKNVNIKLAVILIISGVIGSAIGSVISLKIKVNVLKKYFGIFLIIIAIHEIYTLYKEYIKQKKEHTNTKVAKEENEK